MRHKFKLQKESKEVIQNKNDINNLISNMKERQNMMERIKKGLD